MVSYLHSFYVHYRIALFLFCPLCSKTIIGKDVTVFIKLTDATVAGDSNLYNIVDICDSPTDEVAIVQASPSNTSASFTMDGVCSSLCYLSYSSPHRSSVSVKFSSDTQQALADIELFQTLGSSQSVTKKIKMVKLFQKFDICFFIFIC